MTQILASGKTGANKYDLKSIDPNKVFPRLDARQLAQSLQNSFEETQGYSLSGDEGDSDAIVEDLSIIDTTNIADYNSSLSQVIQTYVANDSFLDLDPTSTANNLVLIPRKISDINAPNGTNYAKEASLPFAFRDNLTFRFRAVATNTDAVQIQIPDLAGLSGAIDLVSENGASIPSGAIVINKFYDIVLTTISSTKKAILKFPNISSATTTLAGAMILPQQITISNNTSDSNNDIDFSAGNFQFSDGSGQAIYSGGTGQLDALFGTGNGMLATGTKQNDSTYHLFMVSNLTTGISKPLAILGVAGTVPNPALLLPSGYTKFKRICSILTDGSGNIRTGKYVFSSDGSYIFIFNSTITLLSGAMDAPLSLTDLPIKTPLGLETSPSMSGYLRSTGLDSMIVADYTTSSEFGICAVENSTDYGNLANGLIFTDTSSRIKYRNGGTTPIVDFNFNLYLNGFLDQVK